MFIRVKRRKNTSMFDNKETTNYVLKREEELKRRIEELKRLEEEVKSKEELKRSIDETIDRIPGFNIVKNNDEILDMIPVETKKPVEEDELVEWMHVEKKKFWNNKL